MNLTLLVNDMKHFICGAASMLNVVLGLGFSCLYG